MHEEALFVRSGKNINMLQKLDFVSTPLLKATDSFPAITVLMGFELKVNLQCMYFGFLFSSIVSTVQI